MQVPPASLTYCSLQQPQNRPNLVCSLVLECSDLGRGDALIRLKQLGDGTAHVGRWAALACWILPETDRMTSRRWKNMEFTQDDGRIHLLEAFHLLEAHHLGRLMVVLGHKKAPDSLH